MMLILNKYLKWACWACTVRYRKTDIDITAISTFLIARYILGLGTAIDWMCWKLSEFCHNDCRTQCDKL